MTQDPVQDKGWLSSSEKLMICFLKGKGNANREIARKMHRSHTCINNFVTRYLTHPTTFVRPVDPSIELKFLMRQYILAETLADRFATCRHLSGRIESEFNVPCSKSQVALIRRSLGLRHLWAKKTEKLSPKHVIRRLAFARVIQRHEAFEYPWIISDESSFVLCPTRRKLYRFRGENSECVFQEFQGYPVKCMVWGAIGPNYKSPLIWFQQHVTSESYVAILMGKEISTNTSVLDTMDLKFGHMGYIFQQDGARPHTAKYTMNFLRDRVRLLPPEAPWPACSPDLSPIEQVWGLIKHKINLDRIATSAELFGQISAIWESLDISTINNFINTLKPRIWTMEDLNGASITGRNDMVRVYQESGIAARPRVLGMRYNGCINPHDVSSMRSVINEVLKKIQAHEFTGEMENLLHRLDEASQRVYGNMPQHP
jgi:transposase